MSLPFGVHLKCVFEFVLCIVTHDDLKGALLTNFHPLALPENLKQILKNNGSNSMRKLLICIRAHAKSHILVPVFHREDGINSS